jgi:glucose/arabinose dehydrogenase
LIVATLSVGVSAQELDVELVPFATGLTRTVALTTAPGVDDVLFVTQQDGKIQIVRRSGVLEGTFLDISDRVLCCGERGLLSTAFHPLFRANGEFFVNYTETSGATIVSRFQVSALDPMRGNPDSEEIILRIEQPFPNHNGGQLQFGPDGFLYIGTGDGGSANDPGNRAQDRLRLLGKMLRIDVDGGEPYGIPPTNPFRNLLLVARPEIWATGLRNPWRFSFDQSTGDLFIADVGQSRFEEINVQPHASHGGENYGWRLMEGDRCNVPPTGCINGGLTLPVLFYAHADDDSYCSVTGGYVYRGRSRSLDGVYFYGDFCSGRIWGARQIGGTWRNVIDIDTDLLVSAFGQDAHGEVFVLHYWGTIYRIVDRNHVRTRPVRR